jgi:hyaluronan synthase
MIGGILQFIELVKTYHLHPFLLFFVLCWGIFALRIIMARRNRPIEGKPLAVAVTRRENPASALIMTFRDDPSILAKSLDSITNQTVKFSEILVVMDKDETQDNLHIVLSRGLEIYVDPVGNKRAAYAGAFRKTRGKIVAMLSGDTIYPSNMLEQAYVAFSDPKIGGVGFKQRIYDRDRNLIRRFADIMYDLRYKITYSCLSSKRVLLCTTGETAFFRREPIEKHLPEFLSEKFLGRPCIIGDDRFLTSMILKEGYDVVYQPTTEPALTDCPSTFTGFVRQQLRWYRSNQKYSFKTLMMNWIPDRSPVLKIHLFGFLVLPYLWCAVVAWWIINTITHNYPMEEALLPMVIAIPLWISGFFLAQFIKGSPHFMEEKRDILILPVYALFTCFVILPTFVYALLTIRNQGSWETKRNICEYEPALARGNGLLKGAKGAVSLFVIIPLLVLAIVIGVVVYIAMQQDTPSY